MKAGIDSSRILTASDLIKGRNYHPVEIPEITAPDGSPGIVYIKPPTAGAMIRFMKDPGDKTEASLGLVAESVVDAEGNPLFSREQAENLNMKVFSRLAKAVNELSVTGGNGSESETEPETGPDSPTDSLKN